ncbi:MAG: MotA/TolQ/ExbB proton channel family protein [Akkermansia sp.]|nr:MotA/TolQ/ExbB proton channel family protein [Akkermansia sp.]
MSEMIVAMGPMFWLMMFFAVLALAVVAERLFYYHRVNINSGDFLRGISALLHSGQYNEALHEVRRLPGPMARVVEAVISRPKLERAELRDIATEAASLEVYRVERYVRILLVCATMLPLLGILGTLLTMVAFYEQPGITDGAAAMPQVATTIESALLLSAAGIALAIPCYLFYMYLAARARKIINNIERAGLETAHLICDSRPEAAPTADSPRTGTCRSGACSCADAAPQQD